MPRRKLTCSAFIGIDRRVDPHEARQRLAERDARQAADTRSDVQKFLGDPPPQRSASAGTRATPPDTTQRSLASHPRDL